jgi:hypothetical protein
VSKSNYKYFVGNARDDTFADLSGFRVLCIIPSEYYRDTSSDWDEFEVLVGYTAPLANSTISLWISTENYRRRAKGILGTVTPSPDWEFSSLDDNALTDARLQDISNALKHAAGVSLMISNPAQTKPPGGTQH